MRQQLEWEKDRERDGEINKDADPEIKIRLSVINTQPSLDAVFHSFNLWVFSAAAQTTKYRRTEVNNWLLY